MSTHCPHCGAPMSKVSGACTQCVAMVVLPDPEAEPVSMQPANAWFVHPAVIVGAVFVVLGALVLAGVFSADDAGRPPALRAQVTKSKDNMHSLLTLMLTRARARTSMRWPPYSGKNFVLSVVATGALNRKNHHALAILFSPADRERGLEYVDVDRYRDVTKDALKRSDDFSELTSYAGRRNDDREYVITSDDKRPILADTHFAAYGFVLLGYSDGSVREVKLEALDMEIPEPGEPFLGDDAASEDLEVLSDF